MVAESLNKVERGPAGGGGPASLFLTIFDESCSNRTHSSCYNCCFTKGEPAAFVDNA